MSGPGRDEAKQQAWRVASNMALDFFAGYYSKNNRIALASAIFEDAYAAGRAAGMEQAAKVCETAPDLLQNSTFDGAAAAIRALAEGST